MRSATRLMTGRRGSWRLAVGVVLALSSSACSTSARSGDAPTDPVAAPESAPEEQAGSATSADAPSGADAPTRDSGSDPEAVLPDGFELVAARATTPDGEVCELCLWSAETVDQRRRGLMFVTDLGPADGMAFRYSNPHTGRFWMKNTILPLSIAFFSPDGVRLDAFDMEPCSTRSCPRYATPSDFLVAVEVPAGRLDELGLGEGSRLELLDAPCPDGRSDPVRGD